VLDVGYLYVCIFMSVLDIELILWASVAAEPHCSDTAVAPGKN
jgi:hypothetical protein